MSQVRVLDYSTGVPLENEYGHFEVGAFSIEVDGLARDLYTLSCGELKDTVNVRINSACFTGDLFGCLRCDCNEQMRCAIKYFADKGNGLLIYDLSQEGRGIGPVGKLKSLKLMDKKGLSTAQAFAELGYEVDIRNYSAAAEILNFYKIKKVNLITNNPDKVNYLRSAGVDVVSRIPTVSQKVELQQYLLSKEKEMGHIISKKGDANK